MNSIRILRRSFLSGVVLVAPLVITLFVLNLVFTWVIAGVNPLVRRAGLARYTANIEFVAQLVAVGIIVTVLTAIGYVAQRGVGQQLFGRMGQVMNFVPLVNVVYGSVRQVASALVDRQSNYEDVVLVEYPRDGLYAVGFVTGDSPDGDDIAGEPVYNVYLPNSPNPTQGRLLFVPESQLHESHMTVRQAIRTVVTTGMGEAGTEDVLQHGGSTAIGDRSGTDEQ